MCHGIRSARIRAIAPEVSIATRYPRMCTPAPGPSSSGARTSVRQASTTMSWLALQKATRNDRSASAPGCAFGSENAIAAMTRKRAAWVTSIHPRRRPRNGGTNRSIKGDQRYLIVYGRPTREKIPITVRSTFSVVIHACRVVPVRASGIPEENPRSRTKKMRRFANAFRSADMRGIVSPPREGNEEERDRRLSAVLPWAGDGCQEGECDEEPAGRCSLEGGPDAWSHPFHDRLRILGGPHLREQARESVL